MKNYFPLDLGKFRLGTFGLNLIVLGHLIKGQWAYEKKKKRKNVLLALKPEQGLRGIWWKSLKHGALSLHWLGVTDLNARYKGE